MLRRLLLAVALLGVLASPALGDDIAAKKQSVDAQLSSAQTKLAQQKESASALQGQIDQVTGRIRTLETQVGAVSTKLSTLQQDLELHRERLQKLSDLYAVQTKRLVTLRRQYAAAVHRLNLRLVSIYELGQPTTLEFVLGAKSLTQVLDQAHYVSLIGKEDKAIAAQVARSKAQVKTGRLKTKTARASVRGEQRLIQARVTQVAEVRDSLVGAKDALAANQQQKVSQLSNLTAAERAEANEIDSLQASSNAIAAQIRAAQQKRAAEEAAAAAGGSSTGAAAAVATPSSAGLIWPVSGPITSPFGMRWGKLHPGIDIGVPIGTPIHAAAAGTVIYCGWETGYGNFVVLDNGGDLATAYGHQSAIAVTCGQQVTQGQVIGYTGCTGECTGPHLHFEVRINGNPVDPMGYLS